MRFLLYNICYATHGNQKNWPLVGMLGRTNHHLDEIIQFIGSEDPDVIGLVEVDGGSYRSRRKSQPEQIAEALGHFHCYSSKYGMDSRWRRMPVYKQQGNAFLTKDTIHNEYFHFFDRGMKRLVIELELEHVTFFLVHLALSYKTRQEQIRHLYHLVKETNRPYIVAGDFNAFMGEQEIQLFLAATDLQNADPDMRPSYPSSGPKKHLDFILHSPDIHVDNFWMPDVQLSDHLPLVVDFTVIDPQGQTASMTAPDYAQPVLQS